MDSSVQRIDDFIVAKGFVSLANDSDWQKIIDRVLSLYGRELYYRSISITQQPDPMCRFFTEFPDNLTAPNRHIKYLELLVTESPILDELTDWLHSIGIPTQWILDSDETAGALRIFGFVDPNQS